MDYFTTPAFNKINIGFKLGTNSDSVFYTN